MPTVILVGAGRMGGALLQGWIASAGPEFRFIAIDPNPIAALSDLEDGLKQEGRFSCYDCIQSLPQGLKASVVVLATKPNSVLAAARDLAEFIKPDTIVISVAAGVDISAIEQVCPDGTPVLRIMPNIGALVGCSVSAGYAPTDIAATQKDLAAQLFAISGYLTWVNRETDLHIATALSGSGPAYYFAMCEEMIAAAVAIGLPKEIAERLAIGTVTASGQLLADTPAPDALREAVTSPNGTTEAGLNALSQDCTLRALVTNTLRAATQRSIELSEMTTEVM